MLLTFFYPDSYIYPYTSDKIAKYNLYHG